MSLADEVHALELERDTLKTNLAAARQAFESQKERGSLATQYWRSRAEQAEGRAATLEAYQRTQEYAQKPIQNLGKWNVAFSYDHAETAGLDFEGGNLAQMVSGLLMSWLERPRPFTIQIAHPESDDAIRGAASRENADA